MSGLPDIDHARLSGKIAVMRKKLPASGSAARLALLRLHHEPGVSDACARVLFEAFDCPVAACRAGPARLRHWMAKGLAQCLASSPKRDVAQAMQASLEWARGPDCRLLTWLDQDYPACLHAMPDPPVVLYARGNLAALSKPMLAIVGARDSSRPALSLAGTLARAVADKGWCVVSGLGRGLDAAAHKGALAAEQGSATLAVMGTGPDRMYPPEHAQLARSILGAEGLLITELCPGARVHPQHLLRRQRLIAGLSRGVVVVQAKRHSSALKTAKLACDLGREVFAVPGAAGDPFSVGTHQLIREGAALVESAQDIWAAFGLLAAYR
jgi:DNA processing protein